LLLLSSLLKLPFVPLQTAKIAGKQLLRSQDFRRRPLQLSAKQKFSQRKNNIVFQVCQINPEEIRIISDHFLKFRKEHNFSGEFSMSLLCDFLKKTIA